MHKKGLFVFLFALVSVCAFAQSSVFTYQPGARTTAVYDQPSRRTPQTGQIALNVETVVVVEPVLIVNPRMLPASATENLARAAVQPARNGRWLEVLFGGSLKRQAEVLPMGPQTLAVTVN